MKKILICFLFLLCMSSCKKNDCDYMRNLFDFNKNLTSYESSAKLNLKKENGDVSFDITTSYLSPDFYKVILKNCVNNNIQVIIKNEEGVFVLTPALNKQFKFNCDWPLSSSHAYIFQSIVKDISNTENPTINEEDKTYCVESKVNHKTNANLKMQRTCFDKKTNHPLKNTVYDSNNNAVIEVDFLTFNTSTKLSKSDFDNELVNKTVGLMLGEGQMESKMEDCVPTFLPEGYILLDRVLEENYQASIYKDDSNKYLITCVGSSVGSTLTTSKEYDDIVVLETGLGFLKAGSLAFYKGNLLVTIYSQSLSIEDVVKIANSFK